MADKRLKPENKIDERANEMFDHYPDLQAMEKNSHQAAGEIGNESNTEPGSSSENIDNTRDAETARKSTWRTNVEGNQQNNASAGGGSRLKSVFRGKKKKSATAVIISMFIGGGILGTFVLSPTLLLVQMKNVFLNSLSDSTPASSIRSSASIRGKIKGLQANAGVCTNVASIRCKFSTMSNRQANRFEKAGFEIEKNSSKIPLRTGVDSMKFKLADGRTIKIETPQDMKNFAKTPEGSAALFKAFNPKTAFFLNGDFSDMIKTKFHLSKESKVTPGDDKEVKASFDESTGAADAAPAEEGGRFKESLTESDKIKGLAKGSGALAGFGLACEAYNSSNAIINGVKLVKIAAVAAFAYTFLTETDKMIAGDGDASVLTQLGNQATSTDNRKQIKNDDGLMVDNPDYGKSATDSAGYQVAENNTVVNQPSADKFSLAPTAGALGFLASVVALPTKFSLGPIGGKLAFRSVCQVANSKIGQGLGIIAQCSEALAGTPIAAGICFTVATASTIAIGALIGKGIGELISYIIKNYGSGLLLDAKTYGPDVGNAYFAGASSIFGGMASSMGMMPASASSLKSYFADTDAVRKQNITAQTYLAKSTPYDIYNQYSFLGSIVQPINTTLLSQTTIASKVAGLFNLIPSSFASIGTASAAYNEPEQSFNPQRFNTCQDPDLIAIGVNADVDCQPRYSLSNAELNMDQDTNAAYMANGGYTDPDTGLPTTSANGQLYQKFIDNCGENRTEPLGSSEKGYDATDWDTGKDCGADPNTNDVTQEQLSNFRVFTMDMKIEDASSQDPSATTAGSTASSPTTPAPGLTGGDRNSWYKDWSATACAPGSKDIGISNDGGYTVNGTVGKFPIRMCALDDITQPDVTIPNANGHAVVNSAVSQNWETLAKAAKTAKISLVASSSYRTFSDQCAIIKSRGGSNCTPGGPGVGCQSNGYCAVGGVGSSNHGMGFAIDFNGMGGICSPSGSDAYKWMRANSRTYGLGGNGYEPWHYDKDFFYINPTNGMTAC